LTIGRPVAISMFGSFGVSSMNWPSEDRSHARPPLASAVPSVAPSGELCLHDSSHHGYTLDIHEK
jgi:hypothetical protein